MYIRKAETADLARVMCSLRNKGISYITPAQARRDIINGFMYVCIDNDKIVGSICLVPELHHGYTAIKRACVYNRKNCGKGYIGALFQYVIEHSEGTLGCTPWAENTAILHLMNKYHFQYEKTVCSNYLVHTLHR